MAKKKFYGVALGRKCGIYTDWASCEAQVSGFKGALFQGFARREEAEAYLREHCQGEWEEPAPQAAPSEGPRCQAAAGEGKDLPALLRAKLQAGQERAEPLTGSVNRYCEAYNFPQLTEEQRRAVQQVQGRSLLFAVPGSGKTSVLVTRAGYLLHGEHGQQITPGQLMNLTFTRAAAQEMRERYQRYFPEDRQVPEFRTIHSFCLSKVLPRLRRAGMDLPNYLLDAEGEEKGGRAKTVRLKPVLTETVQRADPEGKRHRLTQDDVTILTIALTGIKNCMLEPADYGDKVVTLQQVTLKAVDLVREYQAVLQEQDCFDYDDMIVYAVEGLQQYPQVRQELQDTYRYWSVDETQDNSRLQQELLRLLVGEEGNLFVVGDDDQSIYAFRGAAPQLLLQYGLEDRVKALVMGVNFRSDSLIVQVAEQFIRLNRRRAPKEMQASSRQVGELAFYTQLPTQEEQYAHILQAAQEAQAGGTTLGVLYRLNASGVPVMLQLWQAGIRFSASRSLAELLQGKFYQEILSLLRFAAEPKELKRFKACRYLLGLGDKGLVKKLEELQEKAPEEDITALLQRLRRERDAQDFEAKTAGAAALLETLRQSTALEAVREAIRFTGLSAKTNNAAERPRLYGLLSAAQPFATIKALLEAIDGVNRQLQEAETDRLAGKGPLVSLSTMHGSKGLQYSRVLLIDSFADVLDGLREEKSEELVFSDTEEERRLFYVAITRAERRLELLTVQQYWGERVQPSAFVGECAQLAEELQGELVEELPPRQEAASAAEQFMPEGKVYAVRRGWQTGIFTSWPECKRAVEGYSGVQYRHFDTRAEAEEYLGSVCPDQKPLAREFLREILLDSPAYNFNYATDLPPLVAEGVLSWLGVSSLGALPQAQLEEILTHPACFGYRQGNRTSYAASTANYTLAYLPANFYKSWLPLARCLEKGALPTRARVLELGPGPGTATLAVLEFYYRLARENPDTLFSLDYEALELEPAFGEIFQALTGYYLQRAVLPNLQVRLQLQQQDGKAFLAALQEPQYDLILESNALNVNEATGKEGLPGLVQGIGRGLRPGGLALLLEPAYEEELQLWRGLTLPTELQPLCPLQVSAVCIRGISLVQQSVQLGIRFSVADHRFSYMVWRKEQL